MALFYARDHLGSVRELTDGAANVRARYAYDPWGRQTKLTGDLEAWGGFTGHPQHAASGLALTLYRGYDAALGRWVSEDPIGIRDGLDRYRYAANGPVAAVDPLGLCSCTDECPSGQWQLHTLTIDIGLPMLILSAGVGFVTCKDKPQVMRVAKIFCATWGLVYGVGVSGYAQIAGASHSGPCRAKDLREFGRERIRCIHRQAHRRRQRRGGEPEQRASRHRSRRLSRGAAMTRRALFRVMAVGMEAGASLAFAVFVVWFLWPASFAFRPLMVGVLLFGGALYFTGIVVAWFHVGMTRTLTRAEKQEWRRQFVLPVPGHVHARYLWRCGATSAASTGAPARECARDRKHP